VAAEQSKIVSDVVGELHAAGDVGDDERDRGSAKCRIDRGQSKEHAFAASGGRIQDRGRAGGNEQTAGDNRAIVTAESASERGRDVAQVAAAAAHVEFVGERRQLVEVQHCGLGRRGSRQDRRGCRGGCDVEIQPGS
jgi:hypothetical protein